MVRSSLERAAADPRVDCRGVEASRSAGDRARPAAAREARVLRVVLPDLSAAGAVYVIAHRTRKACAGGPNCDAVVCVFERAAAGYARPLAGCERSAAPRGFARQPHWPVESQSHPGDPRAGIAARRA